MKRIGVDMGLCRDGITMIIVVLRGKVSCSLRTEGIAEKGVLRIFVSS